MEIVTGALSTLLPKLAVLLTGEGKLQKNLRDGIRFLKDELESMQPALERVSLAPITDNHIRIWARDLRELSYDIEDSIDRFMVHLEVNPSEKPRGLGAFIHRSLKLLSMVRLRHDIASDILGVKELVAEVASRHARYKIESTSFIQPDNTITDPWLIAFYKETTKLVGISGPKEELIKELLMEPDGTSKHCLKVISIVGAGGLGKTTLASVTYQHLREQFDCHAFVSVSLNPDLQRILCSMLRQVSENHYCGTETWPVYGIINKIRLHLMDKRYFIILDDIWEESSWNLIKCALVDNNCGSRIITTSRILDVSTSFCSEVHGGIYKLKPLSHDDSKKLFYRRILGFESCHSELKEISERILRKCGGVPLAINTTASLLAGKPKNINEWRSVLDSIGSGLAKNPNVEDMRKILSISYYGLPSHLKPCLLYLSIFPEDYTISRDQLIRRWISEGFIPGDDVVTLYEHGENYFNELINRSMIEPEYIDTSSRVLDCRVHDMILDLITSLSCDENFCTVLRGQQSTYMPNKIHRLSLQTSTDGHDILKATNLSHLRSLIIFPGATNLLPPLSSFNLLRVLDLEGCHDLDNNQINGLGKLFHLRCLVLKDTNIENLPKQIGGLRCLQILDLRNTRISVLPAGVVQLRQLVRLHVDTSVTLPIGFGSMKSLQALSYICVSKSPKFIKELQNLTGLRILHISLSGTRHMNEKSLVDSLCNLEKLHELFILGGQLSRLPRWIGSSLLCLHKLDIKLNTFTLEDFQNLGAIMCLHDLCLMVLNDETERLAVGIDRGEFQCLVNLSFASNAIRLIFLKKAMPRLENLELAFRVAENNGFDLGLENLSSLKHAVIRIDCWGSSVVEVERASAAIQKAAFLNPNQPKLDVIRHFDNDLIEDDDDVVNVHNEINEIYDETIADKMGPWGGTGGVVRDIKVASCHLESVTICSGTIIDALAFSYWDKNGKHHTTRFWGGTGGSANTIRLGTSEFLMEVSGTVGPFFSIPNAITSLRLVSNVRSYGPFGVPQGIPFCGKVKENNSIVGFFGRSGAYLHAVGVYVCPI